MHQRQEHVAWQRGRQAQAHVLVHGCTLHVACQLQLNRALHPGYSYQGTHCVGITALQIGGKEWTPAGPISLPKNQDLTVPGVRYPYLGGPYEAGEEVLKSQWCAMWPLFISGEFEGWRMGARGCVMVQVGVHGQGARVCWREAEWSVQVRGGR